MVLWDREGAPLSTLNPATITVSVRVNPDPAGPSIQDLVSKDGELPERQYLINLINGTHFRSHVGTSAYFEHRDGTIVAQPGNWHTVTMTYDGVTLRQYVDGWLDFELVVVGPGPIVPTGQPVRLGGGAPEPYSPFYLEGRLDDVRIYDRALGAAEVCGLALLP